MSFLNWQFKVNIENLKLGDMVKIRDLHSRFYKEEFDFPALEELARTKVARKKHQIVGFFAIRPINEFIMVLDQDQPIRIKYDILKRLLAEAPPGQLHAFVQDNHFIDVLQKHFDFRPTKGISLVKSYG